MEAAKKLYDVLKERIQQMLEDYEIVKKLLEEKEMRKTQEKK